MGSQPIHPLRYPPHEIASLMIRAYWPWVSEGCTLGVGWIAINHLNSIPVTSWDPAIRVSPRILETGYMLVKKNPLREDFLLEVYIHRPPVVTTMFLTRLPLAWRLYPERVETVHFTEGKRLWSNMEYGYFGEPLNVLYSYFHQNHQLVHNATVSNAWIPQTWIHIDTYRIIRRYTYKHIYRQDMYIYPSFCFDIYIYVCFLDVSNMLSQKNIFSDKKCQVGHWRPCKSHQSRGLQQHPRLYACSTWRWGRVDL